MSNWRNYPYPEFQDAINWLYDEARDSEDEKVQKHRHVLVNEIRELINTRHKWFAFQQYRDFIRPRNELAKELFKGINANAITPLDKAQMELEAHKCLALADLFLEVSGEKKKSKEDIEEALRVVLGWEP